MKTYWEIPGPSKAPQLPCIAFYKHDGSNLRFEWSRKTDWNKFGTRYTVVSTGTLDDSNEQWGSAVPVFYRDFADQLERAFRDNKAFRGIQQATAYFEYFSESSFCGWHDYDELRQHGRLVLIDVNIHKKGFVLPRDFVKHFGHLDIAEVVYEGNFSKQFVQDVREGKYDHLVEGVVAKGVNKKKGKNPVHGLWMAKAKTQQWLDDLKKRAKESEEFRKALADNLKEQDGEKNASL